MTEQKEHAKVTDVQRNAYQLTLNNPLDKGYDHDKIKDIVTTDFTTIRFFCLADEISTTGTPHTHLFLYFNSRVRFSKVKKSFPEAHIEVARGSTQSNIDYIKKSGKWEDTDKSETHIDGTYEEYGEIPSQKGVRHEYEELYEMIKAGYTNAEILAHNNDYILDIDKLDKVRTTLLIDKYKNTRRLNLKVIYISGATGTGKTRSVLDEHGDSNVYRVSDYQHPFDGYSCEPVIAFDEFRSSLRLQDMLNYLDIYPVQLPARFSNRHSCFEIAYLISNWTLEEQYAEVQKENPASWKAFLRRIHEVRIFSEDGNVTTYDSVQAYLERNETFCNISQEEWEQLPFDTK